MTSGADLFVVCKQCGSEVSPYITECPYCGNRLRRRAPKLPRANAPTRSAARMGSRLRVTRPRAKGKFGDALRPPGGVWAASRPYATIVLVAVSCVAWVVWHAEPDIYLHTAIVGAIHGQWWKLFTSEFVYVNGLYAFFTLVAIGLFGWLLERRHGPAVVIALFFGAGAAGALASQAVYAEPIVLGGNGAALALLAAWAAPDIRAARASSYYEGDLLGVATIAALLLAMPLALQSSEASWLAGVTGGAIGLLVGLGMHEVSGAEL